MYIAIDMGGTNTRIAAFEKPGSPEFTLLAKFPTDFSYEAHINRLIETLHSFDLKTLQGIGLAAGLQFMPDGMTIDVVYTIPGYNGKPLVQPLKAAFNCPIRAANDNVCGVIAEHRLGSLQGCDRAAYLTVSTGTGSGIFLKQGEIEIAFQSQLGHQILDPNGEKCLCGQRGCLQSITGGRQIELRYGKSAAEITDPAFWEHFTAALAQGIVNSSRMTRVSVYCLSGAIGIHSTYLREHLQEAVSARRVDGSLRIVQPVLGENAPLVGAAMLLDNSMKTQIIH